LGAWFEIVWDSKVNIILSKGMSNSWQLLQFGVSGSMIANFHFQKQLIMEVIGQ